MLRSLTSRFTACESLPIHGKNSVLPMASRTKGQEKPKELLSPEDSAEVDSEKVHRKPGQR